jgi:hypothetical protein
MAAFPVMDAPEAAGLLPAVTPVWPLELVAGAVADFGELPHPAAITSETAAAAQQAGVAQ